MAVDGYQSDLDRDKLHSSTDDVALHGPKKAEGSMKKACKN